ncbi:solute carrier family 45 member 3-like [Centruroides sculpturatus]|uniref:solute carrier family 45 member 3-like n=1 Tax=Centruroides sculpturatus TaxID=218467 RepID=UPI000C6DA1FD|nr:solute carrier family 45 member 3-like [Centruroides sculpturatus]XP_023229381.1 solute carrier family 45 member 3-like [Centruroides sculpturatus]XP_023229382.1 solute carrier family 45 member 3-like [Centruroides sculpturatus]XP_023229383.1 solute carrier family 45 member 3-like [Centruroides sculpturatus]
MESDNTDEDLHLNTEESHFSLRMAFSVVKWLKLIGINLVAFGLDLCSSAGFSYVPPLLLKAGFTEELMTIIMGIGPFISLFLVPVIGHWSDKCESKMGRRRPFILFLSLLMLVSLAVIPYSNEINNLFSFGMKGAMFVLATGIILLDFTSQALQNPCKALISDMLISSRDQELGFTVYSCMLSLGGCIGYFISSLNWGSTNLGQLLGSQEKVVFVSLAALFVIFLVVNLFLAQETVYHPIKEEIQIVINGYDKVHLSNGNKISHCQNKNTVTANGINSNKKTETFLNGTHVPFKKLAHCNGMKLYAKNMTVETFQKSKCTFSLCLLSLKRFSHRTISALKIPISSILRCLSAPLNRILSPWLRLHGFIYMPRRLFHLFVVSLFSWMAIMCHDMFYTDFVGQVRNTFVFLKKILNIF